MVLGKKLHHYTSYYKIDYILRKTYLIVTVFMVKSLWDILTDGS